MTNENAPTQARVRARVQDHVQDRVTVQKVRFARRSIRALLAVVAGVATVSAFPGIGVAGITKYRGMHPLSPHTGDYCYIDVLHVHAKAPPDMRVYRVLPNQEHLFVGDEPSLGYDGPRHGYFGPHPLTYAGLVTTEPLFCYLRGPHSHAQKPEPSQAFVSKDGVYWFMGTFAPEFERDRHNLWINDTGWITTYQRPAVEIAAAPAGYHLPAVAEPPKPLVPVAAPPATKPGAKAAKAAKGGDKAAAKTEAVGASQDAGKNKPAGTPAVGGAAKGGTP